MQRWGFYFKSEFWKIHFKFTHSGSHSAKCTGAIFPALPCVLLLVACFAEKSFFLTICYTCRSFCVVFFSGHNALLLICHAHTWRRRDTDRKDNSPSDAGPDGGEWGESGSAITGSAAGPFTGRKKEEPGLGRGHLLFSHLGWFTTDLDWWMKPRSVLVCNPFLPLETEGWGKYLSSHGFYTM